MSPFHSFRSPNISNISFVTPTGGKVSKGLPGLGKCLLCTHLQTFSNGQTGKFKRSYIGYVHTCIYVNVICLRNSDMTSEKTFVTFRNSCDKFHGVFSKSHDISSNGS